MTYDVLAARRQRLEAEGKAPWPFTIGDDAFELPAEPPQDLLPLLARLAPAIDAQAEGGELPTEVVVEVPGLLAALLGDQADRFNAHQLSIQDVAGVLMTYFEESFGGGVGESAGSPGSSPSEPKTPKPTSKARTKSTSSTTTARRRR